MGDSKFSEFLWRALVVGIYILTRGWQQMMGRVLSTIGNIRALLLKTKLCLILASKAETYPSNGGGVFSAIIFK